MLTIHEKQGAGSPIRWASLGLFEPDFDELEQKNQESHRCGKASAGLSSAWEGSELGQFVTFSGWVSATNSTSSGAVGQGWGWVFGRSWSQLVGSIGHQLAGICHQLGQLVGRLLNR